jgi:hypothetical protein
MNPSTSIRAAVLFSLTALLGISGSARADGTNPYHLEANVVSPFDYTGVVTSYAPSHHVVYGGDTSFDVALQSGSSGGTNVWFDVRPLSPATAIRGRVMSGGANARIPACANGQPASGGYVVQIEVQAFYNNTWTALGWVKYAHVDNINVNNGAIISNAYRFATVSWGFDGSCSTGPHVHMEPYNYRHYSCYTNLSPFAYYDTLARVGGGRLSVQSCW